MMKTYEQYNENPHNFLFIIGIPSGEYFDLTMEQYLKLNNEGLIFYDNLNRFFCFNDKNYDKVIDIISDERKEMIKDFLYRNKITNYKINKDYTVDVLQHVKIIEKLKQLPIEFDFILGDFDISDCGLETLKGCPERVNGDFMCVDNKLKDLTYGPEIVGGVYNVSRCGLKTLKGAPRRVGDDFNACENELQDLIGGPQKVDGNYYCDNCLLTSLQGCAEIINGDFDCSFNYLTDLIGGPDKIYGLYDCSNNKLKNVNGAPEIARVFKCDGNKGMILTGIPEYRKTITD